ncbi:GNAT family N-acetyltransferase [Clostridium sp.]|uniref:GNAT family N-acetyltransferase n=1 Tax=Clostridium sp. TaxID=1506 RepID=UPI003F3832E2
MKIFESNRLILRAWTKHDLNSLHEIMSNKKVADLAGFKVRSNINETSEVLEKFIQEPANSLWAIELKELNKAIGWIELHNPTDSIFKDSKEVGIVLAEKYWGHGFAVEALNEIIQYSRIENKNYSIISSHFPNNIQSKKVIIKSGFKYLLKNDNKLYYAFSNTINLSSIN